MTITEVSRVDPAASPPWPLAVGVLLTPRETAVRVRADRRLRVALDTYRLGYYLLDLLEVDPDADASPARALLPGQSVWAQVEDLVARSGADVLVIAADTPVTQLPGLPARLAGLPLRLLAA